jgi:hypothetical protein
MLGNDNSFLAFLIIRTVVRTPFGRRENCAAENLMINKVSAIAIGAVALSAVLGSTAVKAQESCPSMYNRMMGIYQANPYSPAYAQMLPYYNSRCASGASYQSSQPQPYPDSAYSQYEQPGYQQPGYQQPVYQQPGYQQPVYQQPAPYGYGPAPIDPAAAVVGAAIIGGAIAADSDYRGQDNWGGRGGWRR